MSDFPKRLKWVPTGDIYLVVPIEGTDRVQIQPDKPKVKASEKSVWYKSDLEKIIEDGRYEKVE